MRKKRTEAALRSPLKRNEPFSVSSDPVWVGVMIDGEGETKGMEVSKNGLRDSGVPMEQKGKSTRQSQELIAEGLERMRRALEYCALSAENPSDAEEMRQIRLMNPSIENDVKWTHQIFVELERRKRRARTKNRTQISTVGKQSISDPQ